MLASNFHLKLLPGFRLKNKVLDYKNILDYKDILYYENLLDYKDILYYKDTLDNILLISTDSPLLKNV